MLLQLKDENSLENIFKECRKIKVLLMKNSQIFLVHKILERFPNN